MLYLGAHCAPGLAGKDVLVRLKLNRTARLKPVSLPYSKSMAARALILSYVYGDVTRLGKLPECDDTRELAAAIASLRVNKGCHAEYNLGSGGTSLRFFLALVASLPCVEARIDCSDTLRVRPLKPLIDALTRAGAHICCLCGEGYAPLEVRGARLDGSGVRVSGSVSSQFRSALMMVSPLWQNPFNTESEALTVSRPYVDMTRRMIDIFEARPEVFEIEPDWSALSYFYEYALLRPGVDVVIENMPSPDDSLQGDSACAKIFREVGVDTYVRSDGTGVLRGDGSVIERLKGSGDMVRFEMRDVPDLVPALAVGLCFAGIRFRMDGVGHLRHKESDRLKALGEELAKTGYVLEAGMDTLEWSGGMRSCGGAISHGSHCDHRIVMALAVTTVNRQCVVMRGAEAVTKSFPDFFSQLARLAIQSV